MFDLGGTEILLIAIVVLIVIKPAELPTMFRKMGQAYGKIKGIASEFNSAMSEVNVKSKIEEDLKKLDEEFERPAFDFASIEEDIKKRQAETAELIKKQKVKSDIKEDLIDISQNDTDEAQSDEKEAPDEEKKAS